MVINLKESFWVRDRNLGVINIQMICKVMGMDEIIKGRVLYMRDGGFQFQIFGRQLVKEKFVKELGVDRKIEGKLGECVFLEVKKEEYLKEKGGQLF